MVGEVLVELAEYGIFNFDASRAKAADLFFDTVADLASSLIGAIAGGGTAVLVSRGRLRSQVRQAALIGDGPGPGRS